MSQFSLNDWCSEIEKFIVGFKEFSFCNKKNIPDIDNFIKTRSFEVFVERFDYFPELTREELPNFSEIFDYAEEKSSDYAEYNKLADYIEHLTALLSHKYQLLFREGEYDVEHKSTNKNYLTLGREKLMSYTFPRLDKGWLDEMLGFIRSVIKDYFWVKHKVKCQAVEEIIKILQAGGMPCGYKVTKPHEDILQQEVEFLVFWPHKDNA